MTIEQFAQLYVYYVEPFLKVIVICAVVVTLLQVVNVVAGGDKKFVLVDKAFNLMIGSFVTMAVFSGKSAVWFAKTLLRILTVLFDTVRDFFTSKI